MANLLTMVRAVRGSYALLAVSIAVLCSTAAIVATYSRLSHTWDEGTHVSAGLEFLQDGRYTFQTENPPLSRVALAVIPYLQEARLPAPNQRSAAAAFGAEIFYRTPQYVRNVTEARLANLLFFWACVALTWLLAGGRNDPWVAFLASASVATLPPIVAHSGLATTDVAFVASFLLALLALRRVLLQPSTGTGALLGAAVGIATATKFSTFVFLPPAVVAIVACHYWSQRRRWCSALSDATIWRVVATASVVASLVVWGSYGFHVGRLSDLPIRFGLYGTMPTTGWPAVIRDWPIPGHEFIHGLLFSSVPNQITYFNMLAGSEPAYISSDSDFDWGQDALAMERYFDAHPVPELYVQITGSTQTCTHRHPPLKALPLHPVSGWIAISERIYRLNQGGIRQDPCGLPLQATAPPGWLDWLHAHEPVAIIGKTIRLYHIGAGE